MSRRTGLLLLKDLHSVSSISSLLHQSRSHIKAQLYVKPNYDNFKFTEGEISKREKVSEKISWAYIGSWVGFPVWGYFTEVLINVLIGEQETPVFVVDLKKKYTTNNINDICAVGCTLSRY